MSSFWQFFDSQIAILRRVSSVPYIDDSHKSIHFSDDVELEVTRGTTHVYRLYVDVTAPDLLSHKPDPLREADVMT